MNDKYIKSPINYTGNKFRILDQIFNYFPKNVNVFCDLFCGGATVGFNYPCNKVYLIDSNSKVINLLKILSNNNIDELLTSILLIIKKYKLSCSYFYGYKKYRKDTFNDNNGLKNVNYDGYYKLRDDYNRLKDKNTYIANVMLYVLMVYGFNNDFRFNSEGKFNLPVGKTDFNKNNFKKLENFTRKACAVDYSFICSKFDSKKVLQIIDKSDFIYMDPPYLLSTAVYNENKGWSEDSEKSLMQLLEYMIKHKKKFALSNILYKGNKYNDILNSFIIKHHLNVYNINYNYINASYNKKRRYEHEQEVLITNYDAKIAK